MVSISDSDLKILLFLIRNYAARHTTREIGLKLKISPAGSYKSLKKMEKDKIVIPEKLGTGLFYSINYTNVSAFYLACFASSTNEKDIKDLKQHSKAVIKTKNSIFIIPHHHDENIITTSASKLFKDTKIEILSEEDFSRKIITKDRGMIEAMKDAEFIYGSEFIIKTISRMIR